MKSKLYLIIAMLIFGSISIFVREIPLSSAQIALARGFIGSLFLLGTSVIMKRKLSIPAIKNNALLLLASGVGIGFNWIFLFEAYKYTSVPNATLSYYFAPVIVVFLSPFVLKEKLTSLKVTCILAALIGMYFVAGVGGEGLNRSDLVGIGYGLLAATLYAVVILINKFLKGLTGLETTFVQIACATIVLIPYVWLEGDFSYNSLSVNTIGLILIVGFVNTGIAYLLYFSSIKGLKGQTVAIFSYIDPIFAIMLSAVFLGEKLDLRQLFGAVLILGSAFLSGWTKKADKTSI